MQGLLRIPMIMGITLLKKLQKNGREFSQNGGTPSMNINSDLPKSFAISEVVSFSS